MNKQSTIQSVASAECRVVCRSVSSPIAMMLVCCLALALMAMTGCGSSDNRQPLSGTVDLDGQPLRFGVISFRPTQDNAAPGSGGTVIEGRFDIPAEKGLRPGKYDVHIQAFKKTGRMLDRMPGLPEEPERLPVKLKESEKLEATIVADEKNNLTFQVTSAP